ncbi:MAG TPA: Mth938-like domain-containing protein [Xanthobacteraceae bacterium]|nr:Mth938-like domain-containing protein [Xanthobacteraceae bacterium]
MPRPPVPPHFPRPVPIDGYGKGGFRFAGMSHRGSLLCLPSGIWAWPLTSAEQITEVSLALVFDEAKAISIFLLGAGEKSWPLPSALQARFAAARIVVEVARTGTAVSTYNILLGEGRRVAAGLIAVE